MNTLNNAATGETPAQWIGSEFGGREDYCLRDWAWSGNIDAPWLMPAGGSTNSNYDEVAVSQYTIR